MSNPFAFIRRSLGLIALSIYVNSRKRITFRARLMERRFGMFDILLFFISEKKILFHIDDMHNFTHFVSTSQNVIK